ncbi:hypothetical protein HYT54_05395 [Candidatus Woesearchaeota archaeon]|nr:hypothetical protein [Candidatus Woesearchaeota archaeon]
MVGPNGSGKTAVLRNLYTSLANKHFYDLRGRSRVGDFLRFSAEEVPREEADKYGTREDRAGFFYYLSPDSIHSLRFFNMLFPSLGFSEEMLLNIPKLKDPVNELSGDVPLSEEEFYHLAQRMPFCFVRDAYGKPRENDTNLNIEGLVRSNFPNADKYTVQYIRRKLSNGERIRYDTWLEDRIQNIISGSENGGRSNPMEKWRLENGKLIRAADYLQLQEKLLDFQEDVNDAAVWTYSKLDLGGVPTYGLSATPHFSVREGKVLNIPGDFDFLPVDFLIFDPTRDESGRPSSGTDVMSNFSRYFARVSRFFSAKKFSFDQYMSNRAKLPFGDKGSLARSFSLIPTHYRLATEEVDVPDGSELAFFTDEPTVYLDIDNQRNLTQALYGLPNKHPGLQLFAASNDRDFIRAAPEGTLFVVCQKDKPVYTTTDYKP